MILVRLVDHSPDEQTRVGQVSVFETMVELSSSKGMVGPTPSNLSDS